MHAHDLAPSGASELARRIDVREQSTQQFLELGEAAGTELGGRVARECRLPGLAAWVRVRDYRAGQIAKLPNVSVYFDSTLSAEDVLGFGFEHVAVATGAVWRRDGAARVHTTPI